MAGTKRDEHHPLRSVRRRCPRSTRYAKVVKGSRSPRPFRRGRLVFYPSRVELGGVKVCGDDGSGMIRRILDILQCPDARCRRRAYSGEELAELVGTNGGPTAIAGAIRNFRNRVKRTMLLEANVAINAARDVIVNDRQHGYRFSDKIILAERPNLLAADREEVAKENRPSGSPLSLGAANKDSRAKWILTELRKTGRLRKSQIIQRTGWSDSTTRRVLAKLREAGQIVFEGSARSGYWRTV